MLEAVHKPFVPEESTLSGRIQLLLDNLVGVDKIGLDPGEKPSKSQPSDADIAFIDSLVAVPGTAKVIKLNPKKRVELLRKRLEKGDLSESEARNLDRISQELSGIKHRQSKVTPKQSRRDNYLDLIRKKKVSVDPHKAVYANQKKNHEMIWDQKPKNGVMGDGIVKDGIGDYFSWGQDKHGLTKDYLRKHGKDIKEIRTKSDLIAHDDYIELLPKNAKIKIHLPPGNRLTSKRIESGAPSIKRRIKAAEKLKKAGYDVSLVRDVLVHPDRKTGLILNDHSWIVAKEDIPRGFKIEENRILLDQDKLERLKKIVGDNIEVKRVTESNEVFKKIKELDKDLRKSKLSVVDDMKDVMGTQPFKELEQRLGSVRTGKKNLFNRSTFELMKENKKLDKWIKQTIGDLDSPYIDREERKFLQKRLEILGEQQNILHRLIKRGK